MDTITNLTNRYCQLERLLRLAHDTETRWNILHEMQDIDRKISAYYESRPFSS